MTTNQAKKDAEALRRAIQELVEDFEKRSGLTVKDIFSHPDRRSEADRIEFEVCLNHVSGSVH